MARNQSALTNWAQFLGARGLYGFLHSFDVDQNLDFVARLGSILYRINKGRRARAERNVRESFPEMPEAEVQRIVERSYQHMMQLFIVDAIATPRLMTADGWPNYVRIGELRSFIDQMVRGEPAIFLSGHIGNWELLGSFLAALGYPIHALARPLDNPLLDRWLVEMRQARGLRVISKWGAIDFVQEKLRRDGLIAFIADQNAGDMGLFTPFFGRMASTYKSIGLLAMRHKVPVIAGQAIRIGSRFQYEANVADVIRPNDWKSQEDPLFYITARVNRAIERMVRCAPEQYFWVHRRWKSRPKWERAGKPMPERVIEKLRALPWMTPSELDRIVSYRAEDAASATSEEATPMMDAPPCPAASATSEF